MDPRDRLIVALDTADADHAAALVGTLAGHVGVFKVGLELIHAAGMQIFTRLRAAGAARLFYDVKLNDIPNTVAGAMREVLRLGAWCVTVHSQAGTAALQAAVDAGRKEAERTGLERTLVFAVTVLTSIDGDELRGTLRVDLPLTEYVVHLARLAHACGCDGVIASPREIAQIRAAIPDPGFRVVTPGVRPAGAAQLDQARVLTPEEAIRQGADYLVVGRPILMAPDPATAAAAIVANIASASP